MTDAPGAASSAGRQALPFGLLTTAQIMEHVGYRAKHRDNVDVNSAADLGLHYRHPEAGSAGGFFASVPVRNADGQTQMKSLPLSQTAVRTGCKLINSTPKFFAQHGDPNAFPENFQNILDNGSRKARGLLVRHDGLKINALLPRDYVIKDAAELLADFIPAIENNVGKIVGICSLESGDPGDQGSYRVVVGANIMPSLAADRGQYLMMNLNTSETGLSATRTSLGLYRTFCTNSAIRVQTLSEWNHKSSFDPFYDKTHQILRESGFMQDSFGKIFEELLRSPLPFPAADMLTAFQQEKIITTPHADAAKVHAQSEESENQYDLFNILTRSAQDLPTIAAREVAESAAMRIFTEPGGVMEALRRAELNREKAAKKRGPLI